MRSDAEGNMGSNPAFVSYTEGGKPKHLLRGTNERSQTTQFTPCLWFDVIRFCCTCSRGVGMHSLRMECISPTTSPGRTRSSATAPARGATRRPSFTRGLGTAPLRGRPRSSPPFVHKQSAIPCDRGRFQSWLIACDFPNSPRSPTVANGRSLQRSHPSSRKGHKKTHSCGELP